MNTKTFYYFFLVIILVFASCKSDTISESSTADDQGVESEYDSYEGLGSGNIEQKSPSGEFDGFLLGKFTYDIAVDALSDEPVTELQGRVIEFKKNYTYAVSKDNAILDQGKFEYDRDSQRLTMYSTKTGNSQWEVRYTGGTMIWIGTSKFGNNSRQIRLYDYK
jgi:hypothetical protein